MDGTEFRFEKGTRVSLRDLPDPSFYEGMAVFGNEGWITKRRRDRYGLPEVYIHWDTNHWAYNGVQDRWTYEDHFNKVEEVMAKEPSKEEQFQAALAQFAGIIATLKDDEPEAPNDPDPKHATPSSEVEEKRGSAIVRVTEELSDCDSFLVIGARREPAEDVPDGLLSPLVMGFFNYRQDADLLVAAQASAFGARAHQDAVIHMLTEMARDGND